VKEGASGSSAVSGSTTALLSPVPLRVCDFKVWIYNSQCYAIVLVNTLEIIRELGARMLQVKNGYLEVVKIEKMSPFYTLLKPAG